MDIVGLIKENYAILSAVLWVIGTFLKRTPKVSDWLIPWILLIVGIAFAVGLHQSFSIDAVMQGILCTGGAVLIHQLGKQTQKQY